MNETIITATEARIHFGELLRRIQEEETIIVERSGRPAAVLMSIQAFEELRRRTSSVRADSMHRAMALARRVRERRQGEPLSAPEDILRELREERHAG